MKRIIVIGTSAGGVEALPKVLQGLPRDLNAAILVVLHIPATAKSFLPEILDRCGELRAKHPEDGEKISPGKIYVAPPDLHLMVRKDRIHLFRGPKENRHRPAIDPLFRSAAKYHGANVIGIILTGALDDGTQGLHYVKACGGTAIVQNPEEATVPDMPLSAIQNVEVDFILSPEEIRPCLLKLIRKPLAKRKRKNCPEIPDALEDKTMTSEEMKNKFGPPTAFICPDCNGPLWETSEQPSHYRCLTGHAFSPESLLDGESVAVEHALWVAVKTLEERGHLLRRLAEHSSRMRHGLSAKDFKQRAAESEQHADTIRQMLKRNRVATNGIAELKAN